MVLPRQWDTTEANGKNEDIYIPIWRDPKDTLSEKFFKYRTVYTACYRLFNKYIFAKETLEG